MSLKSAVRIGSQRPRILSLPHDRHTNPVGDEAVDLANIAGLALDDWQEWLLRQSLYERRNGGWSAFEVAPIVPRQCGKGTIQEARQLTGLVILGEGLQIHTAHEYRTAAEHFRRMVQLVESCPDIARRVQRIRTAAGEQAIEMRSGARLRFIARGSGVSGRGLSGDTVYLDEAFALTDQMIGALLPTLSARPNPQLWLPSSAPLSTSAVLHQLRKRAMEGDSPRLLYAEWSAADDHNVDPDNIDAWYQANPALGIRIDEEFVRAEREAMPEAEFLRERLGIPDPLPTSEAAAAKMPADAWQSTASTVTFDVQPGECAFAYDVHDGWASICACCAATSSARSRT